VQRLGLDPDRGPGNVHDIEDWLIDKIAYYLRADACFRGSQRASNDYMYLLDCLDTPHQNPEIQG